MGSKTTRVVLRTSTTTTGYYNGHNLVDQEIMEKWLISFWSYARNIHMSSDRISSESLFLQTRALRVVRHQRPADDPAGSDYFLALVLQQYYLLEYA